jgi:hypothetical protein
MKMFISDGDRESLSDSIYPNVMGNTPSTPWLAVYRKSTTSKG